VRRRARCSRLLAVVMSLGLVAAACGGDEDTESTSADDTATTASAPSPDDEGDGGDDEGASAPDDGGAAPAEGCAEPDDSVDELHGENAGQFMADLQCASSSPLEAEGDPVLIGFQNPEGDPNGSFPEATLAAEAAVKYINEELGGLGSDPSTGTPGRPIELAVCSMAINPADSQRCANELAAQDPFAVVSTINFFGNHFPVYEAAGVPVIVTTPVTVADFTGDAFAIGGGGGCLGAHTGLVEFATTEFDDVEKVAVPWADTPPGQVCYYDLERKPLDVLNGSVKGDAERAGSMPDLEHIGVPIVPATPDVTPQVSEVLGFDPDVIIFSAQGADCWNLVDGLGRLGWSPDSIPLVLSGSCVDFEAMKAAGDLAKGIYFTTAGGSLTNELDAIEDPLEKFEAEIYQSKPLDNGLPEDQLFKGFSTGSWAAMLSIWEQSVAIARGGEEFSPDSLSEAYGSTAGHHTFGSTPLSCSTAQEPYTAICNAIVTVSQWDGTNLVPVRERFTGADLVAGTEIKTGP